LVVGWLILCKPWFWDSRTVPYDSKSQFYPTLRFVSQSLRDGELPFWNPYIYGGYPTVSDPQSMIFSPLALILMTVVDKPSIHWFDAVELLHLLMGGLGMLAVCIRFNFGSAAGLYAAAVYMFGGSAAARMQHVPMILAYGYFPFALFALDKALETKRVAWGIGVGLIAGTMAAHQNQAAYLFSLLLICYAVYCAVSSRSLSSYLAARSRMLAASVFTGAVTLAVPLYATLQFLPLSNRQQLPFETAVENSLDPVMFLTLFIRNFFDNAHPSSYWGFGDITSTFLYAGTLPIVLAAYGLLSGALLENRFRFFVAAGILGVLYAVGDRTPFYWLMYHGVPGVSLYRRPTDATFVLNAILSLSTGFLIDRSLSGKLPRLKPYRLLIGISASAGLFAWGLSYARAAGQVTSAYFAKDILLAIIFIAAASGLIHAIRKRGSESSRGLWVYAGLLLLTVDLSVHNAGSRLNAEAPELSPLLDLSTADQDPVLQFLNRDPSEAHAPYRVEIINAGALWANAPMIFRIQSTQGYNPLIYGLYNRTMGAQEIFVAPRPFTAITPGYDSAMFDLLGVRYIVSAEYLPELPAQAGNAHFDLVAGFSIKVWRNLHAFPRVIMPTNLYIEPDSIADKGRGAMLPVDYRSTVVLPHVPATLGHMPNVYRSAVSLGSPCKAAAEIAEYTNNRIVVFTGCTGDGILVLNDVYYPYWHVYVDGEERELMQANYLFRAVHVAPGRHTVVFTFEPFSWQSIKGTARRLLGADS
jgi:hypothetical protein